MAEVNCTSSVLFTLYYSRKQWNNQMHTESQDGYFVKRMHLWSVATRNTTSYLLMPREVDSLAQCSSGNELSCQSHTHVEDAVISSTGLFLECAKPFWRLFLHSSTFYWLLRGSFFATHLMKPSHGHIFSLSLLCVFLHLPCRLC